MFEQAVLNKNFTISRNQGYQPWMSI